MTQHFVDPATLSLPSSSLKRPASPSSIDDSAPAPTGEPPRKRPRSAVTAEERKEARAHRNRIAAQNSRDRRKAQFSYLERRVAELEEENRRLRAGIHISPSPSVSALSEPDLAPMEAKQEQLRKCQEELRERENQELRERIRTLEQGYEAVLRALATQGNPSATTSIPTPLTSSAPLASSQSQSSSSQLASNLGPSKTASASSPQMTTLSSAPPSPTSSNSTLVDSPLLFSTGDSSDLSTAATRLALPQRGLDLSPANNSPTRHLARVANTAGYPAVSLQRVGGAQMVTGLASRTSCWAETRQGYCENEPASDATIARLFAEILASPPLGSCPLPSLSAPSEDPFVEEVLTKTGTNTSSPGTVDWAEQVHAEIEMEKLLEMLPSAQDVDVDVILHHNVDLDADMDFSSALTWDEISVS